jgi:phenylacetic acid degradation operon negative regulatory protein
VVASSDSLPPDRAGSPSSLIVTFAGCYLRQIGGWIAVADLIRLLALVDVPGPAVRQSVLRLKSRGFLTSERRGAVAGYALTEAGRADLGPGDRRIFRYGRADLADGWVLAVFSVPESHRHHRHQLRSQLGWLGFGTVGSGVWAAPAALAGSARALLASDGLDGYVTWFQARSLDPVEVAAWWDLGSLRGQYDAFLDRWAPQTSGTVAAAAGDDAFARYLHLVDDWRLFPRIDPGLPIELLPPDWPGPAAWKAFSVLRRRWAEPGLEYVRQLTGIAGRTVAT